MRTLLLASILAVLPLLPAPALAQEPERIRLELGEERSITGFRPLCDDPSIVSIVAEGKGTIKGLKTGETICSISRGSPLGQRTVYRVIVVPAGGTGKPGGGR